MNLFFYIIFIVLSQKYLDADCSQSFSDIEITKEFMLGHTKAHQDTNFIKLPKQYVNYEPKYLNKYAAVAYIKMYKQAQNDGVKLTVISAYRNFEHQTWLWNRSWDKNQANFSNKKDLVNYMLNYLAMPGTSRHHWGTEIDLCSTSLSWWNSAQGQKTYNWLLENAEDYGFFQPYGELGKTRKTGYKEEKWHWSFGPLANKIQKHYMDSINYTDFSRFKGAEFAKDLNVIKNYVLSVEKNNF